jgi:hypothetical protein
MTFPLTSELISARVANGAALLDEKEPGWYSQIDTDVLDLEHPCGCVLGQTWDGYAEPWESPYEAHLEKLFTGRGGRGEWSAAYGFSLLYTEGGAFDALTAEWRRVILARRGGELS